MPILTAKDKKKRRFNGFDWTELAEMWGITRYVPPETTDASDESPFIDDEATLAAVRKHIRVNLGWDDSDNSRTLNKATGKDMRNFLYKMLKHRRFGGSPIYAALYTIDDDETFAQYFCELLPGMWT